MARAIGQKGTGDEPESDGSLMFWFILSKIFLLGGCLGLWYTGDMMLQASGVFFGIGILISVFIDPIMTKDEKVDR